jgi:hypothetical protein
MNDRAYPYVSLIIIAALAVIVTAGGAQADIRINKPAFADSTPAELGAPDITVTDIGYGDKHLYWDKPTKAYWYFSN